MAKGVLLGDSLNLNIILLKAGGALVLWITTYFGTE